MPGSTPNRSPQTPFSTILPSSPEPLHGSISFPERPAVSRLLLRSVAGRITTRGNVPMPHSSDDPSSDRISAEAPSAQPGEGQESEPTSPSQPATPAEDASIASDPQDRTADDGEAPRVPRRRRRRRRPPHAADAAGATAARQGPAEQPVTAADVAQSGDLQAAPPPEGEPRRRRRRRRGQRRDAGPAEAV